MALKDVGLYYFDDSGAGWLDPDSAWTNEADAFDGGTALDADSSVAGSRTANYLHGKGTTAPATGDDTQIINVKARLYSLGGANTSGYIYTAGLGEELSGQFGTSSGWAFPNTLSTPTGGWTWAKLNALEFKCFGSLAGGRLSRVEIEVTTNRTINNFWGAETGGIEEAFSFFGSPIAVAAPARSGGYSYELESADHLRFQFIADAGGDYIAGAAVMFSDVTLTNEKTFLKGLKATAGTSGWQLQLAVTTGDLLLQDPSGSTIRTITAPFSIDTWYYLEVYWQDSASGDIELFIDGVSQGTNSAQSLASGTLTGIQVGQTQGGVYNADDIYFMSGATSSADRLGGCEVLSYRSSLNSTTPDTDAGAGSAATALTAGTWLGVQTVPFDTSVGGEYTASGGGAGSAITNDVGGSSGGGPSTDTNITGDIVAAKGIVTMLRSGGGATDHYFLLGNDTDGTTRGVDLDPTTSPVTYFMMSEAATIVPTSSEFLQIGFEAVGNQDFSTYDMLATILHVPAAGGPTYISTDADSAGTSTAAATSGATKKADSTIAGSATVDGIAASIATTEYSMGAVTEHYFDGSVVAPDDGDAVWTNDANAFDGSLGTSAATSTNGAEAANDLRATGYSGPTSGTAIIKVRVRLYGGVLIGDNNTINAEILDGATTLGICTNTGDYLTPSWGDYVVLTAPVGGWTWAKLDSIECVLYGTSGGAGTHKVCYKTELEVTSAIASTVTADASWVLSGVGSSDGSSTAQADTSFQLFSSTEINSDGIATAQANTSNTALTEINSDGIATADANSSAIVPTTATSDGASTAQADAVDGNTASNTEINSDGVATAQANTAVIVQTTATSAGISATTSVVAAFALSDTSIAASSTAQAQASATVNTEANSDGIAATSILVAQIRSTVADSDGASTAQANTVAIFNSIASSDGLAITTANAAAIWLTDTSSIAQATTSADPAALVLTTATADGTSSTLGNSSNVVSTDMNAAGTASTSSDVIAFALSEADSTGTSTAQATSGAQAQVTADSTGTSTAQANASDSAAGGADADSVGTSTAQANTGADAQVVADSTGSSTAQADTTYTQAVLASSDGVATAQADTTAAALTDTNITGSSTAQADTTNNALTEANTAGIATAQANASVIVLTEINSDGTSTALAVTPAIYEQEGYRFRNDDGTEITATWVSGQEVDITTDVLIGKRLRILTDSTGDPDTAQVTLQYRRVGVGDWRNV